METETPTLTITLTPSSTPTATPNFYVEVTTPAGEPARIVREASSADLWLIVLLVAILFSIWGMYIVERLRR